VNILAIETSSEACSCALRLSDGSMRQRYELAPRQHTQLLLPMVEFLLGEAGIALNAVDCFAFGRGPGSFTGVRIAASAIQGLALAVDRPVVGISSLAALAAGSEKKHESVLAVFDARMREVYLGAYHLDGEGLPSAYQEDQLASAENVCLPEAGVWHGVGAGWPVHGQQVARLADGPARAGQGVSAEHALPNYLRRDVATPRRNVK
jgi:tRNA threonylcarbamoyladenosine biosynthesis protein TsaB